MKNNDRLKLLDAVLTDDDWACTSARAQVAGLAGLRAKRKARTRLAIGGQLLLGALGLVLCGWLLRDNVRSSAVQTASAASSAPPLPSSSGRGSHVGQLRNPQHSAQTMHPVTGEAGESPYITEDQMLKMFPEGSCLIAEVNGEKQLVFLQEH